MPKEEFYKNAKGEHVMSRRVFSALNHETLVRQLKRLPGKPHKRRSERRNKEESK
jgi:hypothetical protein